MFNFRVGFIFDDIVGFQYAVEISEENIVCIKHPQRAVAIKFLKLVKHIELEYLITTQRIGELFFLRNK